jgi:hypothetical protein
MRYLLFPAVLSAVLVVVAGQASAHPAKNAQSSPRTVLCGQIKNGPFNEWTIPRAAARQLGLPARFRGRTWTVAARGVKCWFAMRNTRVVLSSWNATRPGQNFPRPARSLRGWICMKNRVAPGTTGSSGGLCAFLGVGERFHFQNYGSLTLAQIKRLATAGKLPSG